MDAFDVANQDVFDLKVRFESLDQILHEFDEIQLKIEYHQITLTDNTLMLEESIVVGAEFEVNFYKLKSSMTSIIQRLTPPTKPIIKEESSHNSQLRLPKIDPEKFNGKPDSWLSFYDVYTTMIHENASFINDSKILLSSFITQG